MIFRVATVIFQYGQTVIYLVIGIYIVLTFTVLNKTKYEGFPC